MKNIIQQEQIKTSPIYEDWINRKWRPALAIQYIAVCLFDFIIAPSFTFYFFIQAEHLTYEQWEPITLSASGLYHLAMGTILGVAAWQRSEEKKIRYQRGDYYANEAPHSNEDRFYDDRDYRDESHRYQDSTSENRRESR